MTAFTRTPADSVTSLVDDASVAWSPARFGDDRVAVSDQIKVAKGPGPADTVTVTDSCSPVKSTGASTHNRTPADTVSTPADAATLTWAPTRFGDDRVALSDQIALVKVPPGASRTVTPTDTLGRSDQFSRVVVWARAPADPVTLTDLCLPVKTGPSTGADIASVADQVTVADLTTLKRRAATQRISDTVTLADLVGTPDGIPGLPRISFPTVSLEVAFGIDPGGYGFAYESLARSLVPDQYLRLQEASGNFADKSRRGNIGIAQGTIAYRGTSPLSDPAAYSLDVSGGGYIANSIPSLPAAGAMTLIAWCYRTGDNCCLFYSDGWFNVYFESTGTWMGLNYDGTALYGIPAPSRGTWHLVSITLYPQNTVDSVWTVDGDVVEASLRVGSSFTFSKVNFNSSCGWGAAGSGGGFTLPGGRLAEPMILPYAVPVERLDALYQSRLEGAVPSTDPATWTWTDLKPRLMEGSCRRGRNTELDRIETGQGQFTVTNNDRALEPEYTGSPYYPNVVPMRPVRARATFAGTTYPLYFGYVGDWGIRRPSYRRGEIELSCVDAGEALMQNQIAVKFPEQATGARIHEILDAAGFPLDQRTIAVGVTTVGATDYSESPVSAIDALNDTARTEGGMFFFGPDGKAVYHDKATRTGPPYSVAYATFGDGAGELPYVTLTPDYGAHQVKNSIEVSIPGDFVPQGQPSSVTRADYSSQKTYRPRSFSIATLLRNLSDAGTRADYELAKYKDPQMRFVEMTIEPRRSPDVLFPPLLLLDLARSVTIVARPVGGGAGLVKASHIEAVEQRFVAREKEKSWASRWALSPSIALPTGPSYWILGTSVLDTDTVLAF